MRPAATSRAARWGSVAFVTVLASGLSGCSTGNSVTFADPLPVDSPATPRTPAGPSSTRATARTSITPSTATVAGGSGRIVAGSPQDRLQASVDTSAARGTDAIAVARVVRSYFALTTRWNHEGREGNAAELDAIASGAAAREALQVSPGQRTVGTAAVRLTAIEVAGADALVRACGNYDLQVIDHTGSVVQNLNTTTGFRIEAAVIDTTWKVTTWVEVTDEACR